jgi:hypothetical protein
MSRRITIVAALVVSGWLVAGCGATTGAPSQGTAATAGPSVEIPAGAIRISLAVPQDKREGQFLFDGRPITELEVRAGIPYVFEVANLGPRQHNFWIGTAKDLAARSYDRLTGTHLWSEGSRSVVYTFTSGRKVQWACTLAGHYGRMHGDFLITP